VCAGIYSCTDVTVIRCDSGDSQLKQCMPREGEVDDWVGEAV
jgi:hypothetical protein